MRGALRSGRRSNGSRCVDESPGDDMETVDVTGSDMLQRAELLAPTSMDGDSCVTEIDDLLTQVAEASSRYLHSLEDRSVRAELNVAEVRETIINAHRAIRSL